MATVADRSGNNPVDRRYDSPNRFIPSASIGASTPLYGGEKIVASDTGARYVALGTANGAWGKIESKNPSGGGVGAGFPDASTTGPAAGTSFTVTTGDFVTSSNNQVVANRQINNGQIDIRHSGVIVRDCIVNSQDFTAIRTTVAASIPGCLIERCRLTGIGGQNTISPDFADGVEIRFCDISGFENGIAIGANAMNIHDNYIHGLISLSGSPHIDGIQGAGGFNSLTIRHNTIVSWDTSCIIMQTEGAAYSGLVIDNNRLLFDTAHVGAELAYGILAQRKDTDVNTASNITITNNRIQKAQAAQSYIFIHNVIAPIVVSGNVDDTTGLAITADIS
jgi:hypothetical protein